MKLLEDRRLDWELLRAHDFDAARFLWQAEAVKAGRVTPQSALVQGSIEPAPAVREVDYGSATAAQACMAGEAALKQGQVAVAVLNGGMATRFGGVVKGVVEAVDGKSFIAIKCEDVRRAAAHYGRTPPVVLMNSFATHAATQQHITKHGHFGLAAEDVLCFRQSISVRLTPGGDLFVLAGGEPSYYAPGHGDFLAAIRRSGVLRTLRDRGAAYLLLSNIDNLGATIDPTLIGFHVLDGAEMTVEVTERRQKPSGQWDTGGAPVLLDGRLCVVEGFRFPARLQDRLPDFQTNNMIFSASAIDQEVPMQAYLVTKQVDGRPALQFEAITCEASSALRPDGSPLLRLGLLRVARDGARGRFFPIKNPVDLERTRDLLRSRLQAGWALRDSAPA